MTEKRMFPGLPEVPMTDKSALREWQWTQFAAAAFGNSFFEVISSTANAEPKVVRKEIENCIQAIIVVTDAMMAEIARRETKDD